MPESSFRLASDNVWCPVGKEIAILSLELGEYFGLNESASFLFQCLRDSQTPERLAQMLREEFLISATESTEAVTEFLNNLLELKLIEKVSGESS